MKTTLAKPGAGFTLDLARAISETRNEPGWMRAFREEAWRLYDSLPPPTRKSEDWRHTDPAWFPWEAATAQPPAHRPVGSAGKLAPDLRRLVETGGQTSALVVQEDADTVLVAGERLSAEGVILCDLDTAVREHGELVRKYFMSEAVPVTYDKFAALHGALWSGGTFLYVPAGVEIELPIESYRYLRSSGVALFPHTLIIAERGARVAYVDEYASAPLETPSLNVGVVEYYLGEGANVRYVSVQDYGYDVFHMNTQRLVAGKDAFISTNNITLGSKVSRVNAESVLRGPGSYSEMLGLALADLDQHFDHHTFQHHASGYAKSDLLYKSVLKDESVGVWSGLIRVDPKAQKTDSYQKSANLILSENARAFPKPGLEIEADDVRCTHGATVGTLDPEEIFYCLTRGLTREQAQTLIVFGFFGEVLDRIPDEVLRAKISRKMETKLGFESFKFRPE